MVNNIDYIKQGSFITKFLLKAQFTHNIFAHNTEIKRFFQNIYVAGICGNAWCFLNCLGISGNALAVAEMVFNLLHSKPGKWHNTKKLYLKYFKRSFYN
jgi:hypothetical protein